MFDPRYLQEPALVRRRAKVIGCRLERSYSDIVKSDLPPDFAELLEDADVKLVDERTNQSEPREVE